MYGSLRSPLRLVIALCAVAGTAGLGTYSAYSSTTDAPDNIVHTGTVAISDNDDGGVVVALDDAASNQVATGCVRVTYTGTLEAAVRLHAVVSGPLADHLIVEITRGTGMGSTPSCTGFTADAADHAGLGSGVVFSARMSALPSTWSSAIAVPSAPWTTGEQHVYRVTVRLDPDGSGQGVAPSALRLVWEAQNT